MNKQFFVFNETIMNIFENFIPHGTVTPNDKDPPWMDKQIKTLIMQKNGLYKRLKQKKAYLIHPLALNAIGLY